MIRRVKTARPWRAPGRAPATVSINIPVELIREAQFDQAGEVNMEACPGIIVIGPAELPALPAKDSRRNEIPDERIEAVVEELCRKFRQGKMRDFARVCVQRGVEIGISR